MQRRSARLRWLGALFAALAALSLSACDGLRDTVGPGADDDLVDYYYHLDERVYLDIDPMAIVVASDTVDPFEAAVETLRGAGILVAGGERIYRSGTEEQVRLQLLRPLSRGRLIEVRNLLQTDTRLSFVSPAYLIKNSRRPLVFVNSLLVDFVPEATVAQIDSLAGEFGLRLVQRENPASLDFFYMFKYPHRVGVDFLAIANELHLHPLVRWASPNAIADIELLSH